MVQALLPVKRKNTKKHITMDELPKQDKFKKLKTQSKYLIDTIKMIAYRAETSMANIIADKMTAPDQARRVLQSLYKQHVDLKVDKENKILNVIVHQGANQANTDVIKTLCKEINQTETIFPQTQLIMKFDVLNSKMGPRQNP